MNIQIQKRYQKTVDEFVREDFIEKAYGRALSHAKDEEKPQIMISKRKSVKKKLNQLSRVQRSF